MSPRLSAHFIEDWKHKSTHRQAQAYTLTLCFFLYLLFWRRLLSLMTSLNLLFTLPLLRIPKDLLTSLVLLLGGKFGSWSKVRIGLMLEPYFGESTKPLILTRWWILEDSWKQSRKSPVPKMMILCSTATCSPQSRGTWYQEECWILTRNDNGF